MNARCVACVRGSNESSELSVASSVVAESGEVHEATIVNPLGVDGLLSLASCVEAVCPSGREVLSALDEASDLGESLHLPSDVVIPEPLNTGQHVSAKAMREELQVERHAKVAACNINPNIVEKLMFVSAEAPTVTIDARTDAPSAAHVDCAKREESDLSSAPLHAVAAAADSILCSEQEACCVPCASPSEFSDTRSCLGLQASGVSGQGGTGRQHEESIERQLAVCLQRAWRRRSKRRGTVVAVSDVSVPVWTSIEVGWTGRHEKRNGKLVSHVRFLQWLFRAVRVLVPGLWGSRRVPGWVWLVVRLCRRPRFTKCRGGANLANAAEFKAQQTLADSMLDWYGHYVAILRRIQSGDAVRVFDDFCGGGAVAEGIRRAGGTPFGDDFEDQPAYKTRFGPESFTLGNGVDWSLVRRLQKRHGLRLAGASPPCKFYSTARKKGESKQPPLIGQTRDMLQALFDWYWIENVMGAKDYMSGEATEIDGPFFGLMVFRSRLFETNFKLHVDELVSQPAALLRARMCLGSRNRWRTFDEFGRPYLFSCCKGNAFIPIGETPWRCTSAECAIAMGVDTDHMPYDRLAQAVPPAYSQWVFSQMCMRILQCEYNCPVFTFDEMRAQPGRARSVLQNWLRGVGYDKPSAGMTLVERVADPLLHKGQIATGIAVGTNPPSELLHGDVGQEFALKGGEDAEGRTCGKGAIRETHGETLDTPEPYLKVAYPPLPHVANSAGCESFAPAVESDVWTTSVAGPALSPVITEPIFRELYYAHFGDYDCQWSDMGDLPWLPILRDCTTLSSKVLPTVEQLVGKNTYLEVSSSSLVEIKRVVTKAISVGKRGTRMTIVTTNNTQGAVALGGDVFNAVDYR